MFEKELVISFLSDWHVSSGLGDGAIADSILNRDANGLPFLPGRAVKGALREGAWRIGLGRPDLAPLEDYLWGTRSDAGISNAPGRVNIGSATLPPDLSGWLLALNPAERADFVGDMTLLRKQTELNADKMVVPHTLRAIECGIPGLYFLGRLAVDAPELPSAWLAGYFEAVCAAVKSIGADRARGLGACSIRFADSKSAPVKAPARCPIRISPEDR